LGFGDHRTIFFRPITGKPHNVVDARVHPIGRANARRQSGPTAGQALTSTALDRLAFELPFDS